MTPPLPPMQPPPPPASTAELLDRHPQRQLVRGQHLAAEPNLLHPTEERQAIRVVGVGE